MRNRVIVALAALLAIAAGCGGRSHTDMHAAGAMRVGVETKPKAPQVGENTLRIIVQDASGKALSGSRVEALVFMPAMGSMPRMESRPVFRPVSPGVYEGKFGLIMGGSWDIDLSVTPPDGPYERLAVRLTVGNPEVTWVTEDAAASDSAVGAITLSASRRQEIGVTTAPLAVRDLDHTRRVAGRVTFDESRRTEVTLKFQGYIRSLRADFTGAPVRKGQVLFTVYSPELYSAQREFLDAIMVRDTLPTGPSRFRASELAEAARQRLALWDLSSGQIAALEKSRKPQEAVPFLSPVSGIVTEKMVVQGSSVMPGTPLFRIAPIDPIWIVADIYPYELPLLKVGDPVKVNLPLGGKAQRGGRVSFIYPYLEGETRTGQVRVEVPNGDRALLPGQLVDVEIRIPLGKKLALPASAVLFNGDKRIVFVDRGGGRLEPREVVLGPKAGDWYPVDSGLMAGDVVVTSGNFLVAAESRLRTPENAK